MRRMLIVSPHFPPVNAPDMQRIRLSLPAFAAAGWEITVLTVDDPTPTAPIEPELISTIPAVGKVVRAFCLSRNWTRWLGVNNVALRSLPFLFLAGCRLLMERRYDVVYFSTTMFVVLPFGRVWKNLFGVPYVIDLQDPWVGDFYERPGAPPPPGGWKYRVVQSANRLLERWTITEAAHVISVSAAYVADLRVRHPILRRTPMTELPFGSSERDLQHVRSTLATRRKLLPPGGIRLGFAGAISPGMLPAVDLLFAAMAEARRKGFNLSAHFFGTRYSPDASGKPVTHDLVLKHGLTECVHETINRIGYFDAIQVLLETDLALLFGSMDTGYIPSKLMTVVLTGKPILALAPEGSALVACLIELGHAPVIFPNTGPDRAAVDTTVSRLNTLASGSAQPPQHLFLKWSADSVAERQMDILLSVAFDERPHAT